MNKNVVLEDLNKEEATMVENNTATNEAPAEVAEEKAGFFKKVGEGLKKVWNSKPVTVIKKVAPIAGAAIVGFVAGTALSKNSEDTDEYEEYSEDTDDYTEE